jgi:hypothetical protein
MHAGCFDQNTGKIYATGVAFPSNPQAYSVAGVPTGANCFIFAVIDQNQDGMIDAGDISNTDNGGNSGVVISGNLVNQDLTLPSANATATLTTNHSQNMGQIGDWFSLNFQVRQNIQRPVTLQVTAGPNMLVPEDVAKNGSKGFQFWTGAGSVRPTLGDTYSLLVAYSDIATPPETLHPTVAAVLDSFVQSMTVSAGTQPTYSWSAPAAPPAGYTYQFSLSDSTGNQIWNVPGNNSNTNGLASSVTSLLWDADPTDPTNHPSVPSLTIGVTYQWMISVRDINGNSAQMQQSFTP